MQLCQVFADLVTYICLLVASYVVQVFVGREILYAFHQLCCKGLLYVVMFWPTLADLQLSKTVIKLAPYINDAFKKMLLAKKTL